jgi:hypothetical protein
MQMKVFTICFICGMCIFFTSPLLAFYSNSQDTTETDTVKLDYENVTVSVVTDWGTSDKHENANVRLVWSGKKVKEIVVFKKQSECRITLTKGIVVTISDTKTGKVLKQFK